MALAVVVFTIYMKRYLGKLPNRQGVLPEQKFFSCKCFGRNGKSQRIHESTHKDQLVCGVFEKTGLSVLSCGSPEDVRHSRVVRLANTLQEKRGY